MLGRGGGTMAGATGFVCDWLFVTAMREMKEVNNGRRNQTPGGEEEEWCSQKKHFDYSDTDIWENNHLKCSLTMK